MSIAWNWSRQDCATFWGHFRAGGIGIECSWLWGSDRLPTRRFEHFNWGSSESMFQEKQWSSPFALTPFVVSGRAPRLRLPESL